MQYVDNMIAGDCGCAVTRAPDWSTDMSVELSVYEANRSRFTTEEMANYRGRWVAFSSDGSRIVASSDDLAELDRLVLSASEDPQAVRIERISDDSCFLGGIELE